MVNVTMCNEDSINLRIVYPQIVKTVCQVPFRRSTINNKPGFPGLDDATITSGSAGKKMVLHLNTPYSGMDRLLFRSR